MKNMIALLCLLSLYLTAQSTISVDEIRPGMTGYGLSVFRGTKIEKFNVEVIDIMRGALPKQDMILVHCKSGYGGFDLESSGLISGMSGSPIYIDGKLAGALAYGWGFAKETIAGITPISNMLREVERPLEHMSFFHSGVGGLVPLKSPLMVSGVTSRTLSKISDVFKNGHFTPIQSGSLGQAKEGKPQSLVPGAAIGVQLISGDMDLTAIGTVTWVEGDKVLAFGHPFFNMGEISAPITAAHISMVMKSQAISFKMGYPTQAVGSLIQDRNSCIYGKMGKLPTMIPMNVNIRNKITQSGDVFRVNLIRHSFITPQLSMLAIYNFLDQQEASWGENTMWIRERIYIAGRKQPLENVNMYTSPSFYSSNILQTLPLLLKNPFEVSQVEKIEVELELAHKLEEAYIHHVTSDKTVVECGENLNLQVHTQVRRGDSEVFQIRFPIPSFTPSGKYILTVAGGMYTPKDLASPESTEGYIATLQDLNKYKNNEIIAVLEVPKINVVCHGQEMKNLPQTIFGTLLSSNRAGGLQILMDEVVATQETTKVVHGTAKIAIEIKSSK